MRSMNKVLLWGISCIVCLGTSTKAQVLPGSSFIKEMKWGIDYQINLTLANDSNYIVNINDLVHSNTGNTTATSKEFVYYPVMLARDFVDKLKNTSNIAMDSTHTPGGKPVSLWGALHTSLGGGWVHFVNCLQYSLEKQYLSLSAPLMERPKTNWKPKPATPTWKRTHQWTHYVPIDQKHAHKEYKLKKEEHNLANLQHVPAEFIQLFLSTNNKEYKNIVATRDFRTQSKIDLVKLLVGANYLSNVQISYIKSMVLKSVVQYSFNQLPTIIVFDDIEAAVAMSLNENGYTVDKVVFKNEALLTDDDKTDKKAQIEQSVRVINIVNQNIFVEKLQEYYK